MRGSFDVADGIVAALTDYALALKHNSPNDVEDFWDLPHGAPPTPKKEERASDKLRGVIQSYFKEHGVVSDREVQLFRRLVPRKHGGEPGSETDVLCRVPAVGSEAAAPLVVPIEVKLSFNDDAPTALRNQLCLRYMLQVGSNDGVYVLVWMDAPEMPSRYKPQWTSLREAKADLEEQARVVGAAHGVRIQVVIVDASLR